MNRTGNYIQTHSGVRFYPQDIQRGDICIEDIAHALSQICRFTGHTKWFYSVGQHALICSYMMPEGLELYGLLHDASEAYLCDVARPIKYLPEMEAYRRLEADVQTSIYLAFGLNPNEPVALDVVDKRMLFTEKAQLMAPLDWGCEVEPYPIVIEKHLTCSETKRKFLARFHELRGT